MKQFIDVPTIEYSVFSNLQVAIARVRNRVSLDSSGAVIHYLTLEEALVISRDIVVKSVDFRNSDISGYLLQFPELSEYPSNGVAIKDAIEVALHKVIFARVLDTVRDLVIEGFYNFKFSDLENVGSEALVMFDRHLSKCPFASVRIRPSKLKEVLDQAVALPLNEHLEMLKQQFAALISELRTRSPEARQFARRLREANEFIGFIQSGYVKIGTATKLQTTGVDQLTMQVKTA